MEAIETGFIMKTIVLHNEITGIFLPHPLPTPIPRSCPERYEFGEFRKRGLQKKRWEKVLNKEGGRRVWKMAACQGLSGDRLWDACRENKGNEFLLGLGSRCWSPWLQSMALAQRKTGKAEATARVRE